MNQEQWEAMTEEQQTAYCLDQVRAWLAELMPPLLTGSGRTRALDQHIYQEEESQ